MPPVIISNSGPATVNISQSFAWNIEQYLQCSKTFEWHVGEGPLFWYRIEWKDPICPPNHCIPGISVCSVTDSACCTRGGQTIVISGTQAGFGMMKTYEFVGHRPLRHYSVIKDTPGFNGTFKPNDVPALYGWPGGSDCNNIIAIVELGGGYYQSDVYAAFNRMGLPPPIITNVNIDSSNSPGVDQDADGEVALDIQVAGAVYAHATGKPAKIYMIWAQNSNTSFAAAIDMAAQLNASVVSISWGGPENTWSMSDIAAMERAFNHCLKVGCVPFCASGDSGASDGESGLNVDYPASSPKVVGCGGTTLNVNYEIGWSNSGGGFSSIFPAPDFQPGFPSRGVPDVAGDADPQTGYQIVYQDQVMVVGGTSGVAPLYAGEIAAIYDRIERIQNTDNPRNYMDDQFYLNPGQFRDITVGNNGGYSCGPGWDAVTGLGVLSKPCGVCNLCEVWTMLATSVQDLCEQLNTNCCRRPPRGKVFSRVQKWGRPALCCDVDRWIMAGNTILDAYTDVSFCNCACVSWVDPCDCGDIHVPCDSTVPLNPCISTYISAALSAGELFGLPKLQLNTKPGFDMTNIKVMKTQVDSIVTKCGILPSNLKLKHNLGKSSVLKEFLARNRLNLPDELDLVYNKAGDSWQKTTHLNGHDEKWTVVFSWVCSDEANAGNYGWKSDIHVSRQTAAKKQNTRVLSSFSSHGTLDGKHMFGVNFNYNTNTNRVTARQPVIVKNQTMYDEIGLFRGDWAKDPYLTVNVSVDKKG